MDANKSLPLSLKSKCVLTVKLCKTATLKIPEIGFQDQLSLNAGQKYCRMLPLVHSAKFVAFIKLPFVIKIFVLSIFEWPFYAGFAVLQIGNINYFKICNT